MEQADGTFAGDSGGIVQFHFERSDGTSTSEQQLSFTSAAPIKVYDEWAVPTSLGGWEKIVVDHPIGEKLGDRASQQATFQVICR